MMNSAEASGVVTFVKELCRALECKSESVKCKAIECEVWTEDTLSTNHYPLITNYDVVHIHGLWRPVFHRMCMKASEQGVPVVWSTHGMTAPWSMAHKRWKKLVAWWLYQKWDLKRAAVIHSTVEQEREWNRALGLGLVGSGQCVVGSREVVAPLGTNLPEREKVEGGRLKVEQRRTLLFVGRVYPVKALDRLIEAFARIIYLGQTKMYNSWCLRIVGPDEAGHMAELMRQCEALGLSYSDQEGNIHRPTSNLQPLTSNQPQVVFVGPKFGAELEAEYENCDCLALVSHTENFGATVVDAMAHGKPVITSTATPWIEVEGGRSEVEQRCGWWVDNDVETLSKAIREMMSLTDAERAELGKRGRRLVEERYTWEAVAKTMLKAYEDVVGGRKKVGG